MKILTYHTCTRTFPHARQPPAHVRQPLAHMTQPLAHMRQWDTIILTIELDELLIQAIHRPVTMMITTTTQHCHGYFR